ncbi:MAG: N-acetyltransferase [Fusobacteriaceae bacterium]|jgi:predicted GNAT family acetyltransferase|nr:N-acetyltransferase [Fusobacteriaceae bacterium]
MDFIKEKRRIFAKNPAGQVIAEVTFPPYKEDAVVIDHTFVDDSLRGQGVGGQLMEAVYDHLKKEGKSAVLLCSYAVKWYMAHPERGDIVVDRG